MFFKKEKHAEVVTTPKFVKVVHKIVLVTMFNGKTHECEITPNVYIGSCGNVKIYNNDLSELFHRSHVITTLDVVLNTQYIVSAKIISENPDFMLEVK